MSFMVLPPEIRALVYQYLIPDLPLIPDQIDQQPLRQDGQPCAPALLLANRTIYNELVRQWYSNTVYTVYITGFNGIRFPGHPSPSEPDTPLPSVLRHVKSLRLIIQIAKSPEMEAMKQQLRNAESTNTAGTSSSEDPYYTRAMIDNLLKTFAQSEHVPSVHLVVTFAWRKQFMRLRNKQDDLFKTLEWNLGPLKDRFRLSADRFETVMPERYLLIHRSLHHEKDVDVMNSGTATWAREYGLFDTTLYDGNK